MENIVEFIDKHKGGILITILLHFTVIICINFSTFQEKYEVEKWSFQGKNIETDDIEITVDQVETRQEMALLEQQNYLNAVKDEYNEQPAKESENYSLPNDNSFIDAAYDFEESVKQELAAQKGAQEIPSSKENNADLGENNQNNTQKNSTKNSGSTAPPKGETMVNYNLSNRKATKLRNPGYTCGNENGRVVVRIKVDQGGVVLSAKYAPELSQSVTSCMISKAESYALRSKFNFSSTAPKTQAGTITYTFIFNK